MHATLTILRQGNAYAFTWTSYPTSELSRALNLGPISLVGQTPIADENLQPLRELVDVAIEGFGWNQASASSGVRQAQTAGNNPFVALGRLLFSQLIPRPIQQQINQLPSESLLQVMTDDVNQPWELLHDAHDFLALRHIVSRLPLLEEPQQQHHVPTQPTRVGCLLLANPTGDLPATEDEIDAIAKVLYTARERVTYRSLFNQQVSLIQLQEMMATQAYGLIHYAGHAEPGSLLLAQGVKFHANAIQQALLNHPVVILNACAGAQAIEQQGAHSDPLSVMAKEAESLASAFIRGGAMAVVGMLWDVPDEVMSLFGQKLYAHLVDGLPIGEALRQTRRQLREVDKAGSSWLAPVLYGDAQAVPIPAPIRQSSGTVLGVQFNGEVINRRSGDQKGSNQQSGMGASLTERTYYLSILCQRIEQYGGTIVHAHSGGLLATFGHPQVNELDAREAIRAAREIHRQMELWGGVQPSSAIASGVLGSTSPLINDSLSLSTQMSTSLVVGEPFQVIKQLLNQAKKGEILVNQLTRERSADLFDFLSRSDITLDEVEQPIFELTFPATHVSSQSLPTHISIPRKEQRALEDAWEEVQEGEGRIIGISGEAGVGKSHLINSFRETLPPEVWAQVACTTGVKNTPYGLVIRLFRLLLRLSNATSNEQIIDTVDSHFGNVSSVDSQLLTDLLGSEDTDLQLPEKAVYHHQLHLMLETLLLPRIQKGPIVMVVEDAHLSDSASLEVLSLLIRSIEQMPILTILLYRREWTPPWADQEFFENIPIRAMRPSERQELVKKLLGTTQLPEGLLPLLDRSGGNPLFLTEMITALVHNGQLQTDDNDITEWQLHGTLESAQLPDTIQRTIEMRLDRLDREAHQVLAMASVIGSEFDSTMLQCGLELTEEEILSYLNALVEQNFFRYNVGNRTYEFRHMLIQEVAYMKIPGPQRHLWHGDVARLLELEPNKPSEFVAILAYHYYKSLGINDPTDTSEEEYIDKTQAEKAYHYLMENGRYALSRYGGYEAVTAFWQADSVRRFLTLDAALSAKCHVGLGDAYNLLNDFDRATKAYKEAYVALHYDPLTIDSRAKSADIARKLARIYKHQANYGEADAWIKMGFEKIKGLDDIRCQAVHAILLIHAGSICYDRGDHNTAEQYCKGGLTVAEKCNADLAQAEGHFILGAIMRPRGDYGQSLSHYAKSLNIYQEHNNAYQVARLQSNIGIVYYAKGEWVEARSFYERSRAFWKEIQEQDKLAYTSSNLGLVETCLGNWEQAEVYYLEALNLWTIAQHQRLIALCHNNMGSFYIEQEAWGEARVQVEESIELLDKLGIQDLRPNAFFNLAQIELADGELDDALRHAQQARSLANQGKMQVKEAIALRTEARILAAKTDYSKARNCFEKSYFILDEVQDVYEMARTMYHQAVMEYTTHNLTKAQSLCTEVQPLFQSLQAQKDLERVKMLIIKIGAMGETIVLPNSTTS
ncbi:MAG: tetratricopeptide repeat protein [Chloroflexota bacterium]